MKKWRGTVCDLTVENAISAEQRKLIQPALNKLVDGLFVVTSNQDGKANGQICNTVFQITSEPFCLAIGINKHNLTHEYVLSSGLVGISVLGEENLSLVRTFGDQSGRKLNKLQGLAVKTGVLGVPLLPEAIALIEAKVRPELTVDLGSHSLFILDVAEGEVLKDVYPLTYENYRGLKNQEA